MTDEDLCRLILLPFMATDISRIQRTTDSVQIANELVEKEKRDLVIKLMTTMAEKLLSDNERNQIEQLFE
ncbi:hypothetical protein [Paenibacillus sp. Pae15]|uniref:hypothetical protein n=2 Tax=unclassified Paenibacillus TaxID=185978 RepID=UPI0006D20321|nr:hypothetical protein [Paenibacillus sp. Pae15]